MSASVVAARLLSWFQIDENTGGAVPAGVACQSTFKELDQQLNLSASTNPAPALLSVYKTTIGGGGYTIDVTAAQGTNGNVNANGKKLIGIAISNPAASAGDVTVKTSVGSNPYTFPPSAGVVVKPGGFATVYFATALTAIDGTHKTIDVAGTNGDTPEIALLFA